jgi:hypothetical protein
MDKIRLYDFLSFLLPGLLVSLAISFFFSYVIALLPSGIRCEDLGSIGSSIMFLLIAFLIGHVIQAFGNAFELRQTKYWGKRPLRTAKHAENKSDSGFWASFISFWATVLPSLRFVPFIRQRIRRELGLIPNDNGGWYSRQLIRPEDNTYDSDTKRNIRLGAAKILDIPFQEEECIAKDNYGERMLADRKHQLIFDRIYRFILLNGIAPQTDDFNSQYGFYRGICVSLLVCIWLSLFSVVIYGVRLIACLNQRDYFLAAIVASFTFDFLFFIFRRRYERFAFYFANSVYQNFLVWWLSEKRITSQGD